MGGLDILKELVESGEFEAMLPQEDDLETRLKKLINKAPVMVLILVFFFNPISIVYSCL